MPIIRGTVVRSSAGRDKGNFMIVLEVKEGALLVADGKERPLERPKLKNMKHISETNVTVTEEQMHSNRSIRHALSDFKAHTCQGEI